MDKKKKNKETEKFDRKKFRKYLSRQFPSKYLKHKVKQDEEEEEESEEEEDQEESEEEEEEPKRRRKSDKHKEDAKDINIIFTSAFDEEYEEEDEHMEELLNDENEECNSDDEKLFMKETYQELVRPKQTEEATTKTKKKKEKELDVEGEYMDLQELKKHLLSKIEKKPKSKILMRTLEDCNSSIKELVKKARCKNAKFFYG